MSDEKPKFLKLGRVQIRGKARREIGVRVRGGKFRWRDWNRDMREHDITPCVHSWGRSRVFRVGEDVLLVHDAPQSGMYALFSISEMEALLNEAKALPISKELTLE